MKKKIFSLSGKQLIQIAGPQLLVALYVIISFTYLVSRTLNTYVTTKASDLTHIVEYEVEGTFEPPTQTLNIIAANIALHSDRDEVKTWLKAAASQNPQAASFYFGTARSPSQGGALIRDDDWVPPADFDHTTRPWFTGARNVRDQIFAGDPYIDVSSGTMCISFARSVYSSRNEFLGVVCCDLMLDKLSEILAKMETSPNSIVNVVDQSGRYLTNSDPAAIMTKNYFSDTSLNRRKHTVANYLDGEPHSFTENKNFYAVRKLAASPWYVVLEGPMSDFTKKQTFWIVIIETIAFLLIVANVVYNSRVTSKTVEKERAASNKLISETQNLVVAAKENAATSQDQSAAVKEIVATMEDNNELSENISKKIKDVAGVAGKTSNDVSEGVKYLEANVSQLNEIAGANQNTIDGIKSLGDKISNIWDIVTLINSVADQAKIIAFNAELEASSAGEAGKNFHIVATEIRRLADGIIDGTKEIKERITEIQESSDSLILASENGTEKIKEGVENAKNLEERFESIKNASEITADSAGDITTIIQQQAAASEQILITLKQIAAGIENFTAATENISGASQTLKTIAAEFGGKIKESE